MFLYINKYQLDTNAKSKNFNNKNKLWENYIDEYLEKLGIRMDFLNKTPNALNIFLKDRKILHLHLKLYDNYTKKKEREEKA